MADTIRRVITWAVFALAVGGLVAAASGAVQFRPSFHPGSFAASAMLICVGIAALAAAIELTHHRRPVVASTVFYLGLAAILLSPFISDVPGLPADTAFYIAALLILAAAAVIFVNRRRI